MAIGQGKPFGLSEVAFVPTVDESDRWIGHPSHDQELVLDTRELLFRSLREEITKSTAVVINHARDREMCLGEYQVLFRP
jgi:hypothetical protein